MKQESKRRNLTSIERERIVQLNIVNSDKSLLGYILTKYLQFNADNKLNSQNELYQTYDDIRNGLMTGIGDNALRAQLKRLVKGGYITYTYKGIEGDKMYRKAIHLSVTNKTINSIMGDDKELKATSKEKYELLQEVRYSNKTKKVFKPEVFNTKTKKANPIIKPVVKPTDELVGLNPTKPIEEPAKEIEEPTEPVNSYEDIRDLDENLDNRAKAKAIIASKANPKIKDYLDKLKLTNYDIMFLLSNDYLEGSDKDSDDKKRILNLMVDNLIKI